MISSSPGPSGGFFITHLLPGGGVPRVHRARSPVPPRLPNFATPWSVHRLAAVAAGAYPPRCPPNVWSPGVPAPPGPCYWLVASGTPVGWRRGCLAVSWCVAQCATTALGGAVPWSCVRGARDRFGGVGGGAGCCVFPVSPFPPRGSSAFCGGPSRLGVPYPRSLVRHSMRSVRWSSYPSGFPRVSSVCVCARALTASVLPPSPQVGVARAPRAVPVLGAGRAVPRGP